MDELSCIQYFFRGNKVFIEEKKEMKKRLHGKSPDRADSVMMTLVRTSTSSFDSSSLPGQSDDDEENQDTEWEPDTNPVGSASSWSDTTGWKQY